MVSSTAPLIVHHMAAQNPQFPPNSREAIQACLEAGAPIIEVDITALGHEDYLLVHDAVLDNETTGYGEVVAYALDDIRQLSYRYPNGQVSPYRVALLSDIVDLMVQYGGSSRIQLDFKNVIPFSSPEPIERLLRLIAPLEDRVIVSSGADWQLRRMRKLAPWLDLGFDIGFVLDWRTQPADPRIPPYRVGAYGYTDDHPLATVRYYPTAEYLAERCEMMVSLVPKLSTFYIDHKLLVQSLEDGFNWAEALHSFGIKLDAWTLDSTNPTAVLNAKRLQNAGLDYLTTNTPQAMADILGVS